MAPADSAEPPTDDALIDACQAFIAWEERVVGLYDGPDRIEGQDERDAAIEQLQAHQEPLLDRICATPAMTFEGARAKATALAAWAPDHLKLGADACWDERLLASLLADLTGRAGA